MRYLKGLMVGLLLVVPGVVAAGIDGLPGDTTWYMHVNFKDMRSETAGRDVYAWVVDDVFDGIKEDTGVDLENELDALTAYSMQDQGPVFLFEGNISQMSKDRLMAVIAAEGDLKALESSGKAYYRFTDSGRDGARFESDSIEVQLEALEDESWISMALKDKVLLTSSEEQMKALLARNGKISGSRGHNGALLILTADKPLVQAGMNAAVLGEESDGDSDWESNILSNTEQVAFLIAAVKGQLAIEARLTTTEDGMAESLASVARGLLSLVMFDDDLDAEAKAMLLGTKIETDGPHLIISLAIEPEVAVATLRDQ